jgi:glycosyltransferase involved in cell wall biosynthesis
MGQSPLVSIVIPTHNRCAQLLQTLAALEAQTWPLADIDVVVVADACEDDTVERALAYAARAPYRLQVLAHSARSAAKTRNYGAARALGVTLLFLDDDVLPQPGLVEAHALARFDGRVVLGYSKPMVPRQPSWFQLDARRWWEDRFGEIAQADHRFTYRDFFSGNVSLPARLFRSVGGFDENFNGRLEDYELGLRLLDAGARFCFEPAAVGYHYDFTDLDTWLRRIRQEGVADVQIGQRHPKLRPTLLGNSEDVRGWWGPLLRDLAFAHPLRGAKLERYLLNIAGWLEQAHMRRTWRRVVRGLRKYNYWRGVGATIGGKRQLAAWLQEAPALPAVATNAPAIDLAHLPPAEELRLLLGRATAQGVRVHIAGFEALVLRPELGAEPLRLEHLHGAVRALARKQFVPALALHLTHTHIEAQ